MFEVCVEAEFCGAHALRRYRGKCERLHGHNWKVQAFVAGGRLDETELLYDFTHLKRHLRELAERLDHRDLNRLPPFRRANPSAENIARWFYEELETRLKQDLPPPAGSGTKRKTKKPGGRFSEAEWFSEGRPGNQPLRLDRVTVWETPTACATYRP